MRRPGIAGHGEYVHLNRWIVLGGLLAVSYFAHENCARAETPEEIGSPAAVAAFSALPDAPTPQAQAPDSSSTKTNPQNAPPASSVPTTKKQPKRILGVMPNYRAVSEGEKPPPPTPRQAFKIATQNSFDYSAFVFVGITSMLAEGTDAHKDLGKGVGGYWAYYWRGFLDKTDGNYLVIAALPSVFHEDERYYTKGEGSVLGRGVYAASRVFVTPNYQGHPTFNASEIVGRGIAQGVSIGYYPKGDRSIGELSEKYGYAIGRDAVTAVFREFWPDIATHVLHRHP